MKITMIASLTEKHSELLPVSLCVALTEKSKVKTSQSKPCDGNKNYF